MTQRRNAIARLAILALAALGTTTHAAEMPPPETVRAQLKTVALVPVHISESMPNHAELEARCEKAVEEKLTAAGIKVVPASAMRDLQDKVRNAIGGYYDPRSGDLDDARWQTYDSHVSSEFRRLHPVDAWLAPRLVVKRAFVEGAYANWDGVRDSSTGLALRFMNNLKAPSAYGTISALSLRIVVYTPDKQVLFVRDGGIQPLEYLKTGASGSWDGLDVVSVPTDKEAFLADPARLQRALDLTLGPLLLDKAAWETRRKALEESSKSIEPVPQGSIAASFPPANRATFLAKFPRVTLRMIEPPGLPQGPAVRERYAAAMAATLERAGFAVVAPAAYAAAWDPIEAASGGFFDPMTGRFLADKKAAAVRETFMKLDATTPVDAVFSGVLVPRDAHIVAGQADWDYAKVALAGDKAKSMFDKSRDFGGAVSAASLLVTATDRNGAKVYEDYGGVQLLVRFDKGSLLSGGDFKDIPRTDWFKDAADDLPATARALRSLLPP